MLLKERQSKQCFWFDTKNGILTIGRTQKKNINHITILSKYNQLMMMTDYVINSKYYLRITKIHSITISDKDNTLLVGLCNYEILEK